MYLADGTSVPDECVKALEELETRWPGATLRQARGAVVKAVLAAYAEKETPIVEDDFEPADWWKVVGSDSIFVIETKDEDHARRILFAYPGSKMFRSFEQKQSDIQWREVNDDA